MQPALFSLSMSGSPTFYNCFPGLSLTLRLCQVKFNLLDLWLFSILSSKDSSLLSNRFLSKWHLSTVLRVLTRGNSSPLLTRKITVSPKLQLPTFSIRKIHISFWKRFLVPIVGGGGMLDVLDVRDRCVPFALFLFDELLLPFSTIFRYPIFIVNVDFRSSSPFQFFLY